MDEHGCYNHSKRRVQIGGSENSIAAANSLLDGKKLPNAANACRDISLCGRWGSQALGGGARYIQANQLILMSRLTLFTLALNSPVSTWTGLVFSHKKKKKNLK